MLRHIPFTWLPCGSLNCLASALRVISRFIGIRTTIHIVNKDTIVLEVIIKHISGRQV